MAPPPTLLPEDIAAAQMFPGLPLDEARLGFVIDQYVKQGGDNSAEPEDAASGPSQASRSQAEYTDRPAPVAAPRHQAYLVVHDFIKNLPAGQPSSFAQEIFVDSEDYTWSSRSAAGWGTGPGTKYRNFNLYNTYQIVQLPNDVGGIGGLCTVYTRKFPIDYEHLPHMRVKEPARKIGSNEADSVEARERYKPNEPIIWQYSATAHMEDQEYKVDAPVPARVEDIGGVSYDVEPLWNDIVAALTAEMTRREMTSNLPIQSFVFGGPQPPVPTTMQAVAPQAKKRRRSSAARDDNGNHSKGMSPKKSATSTGLQPNTSQSMGGSSHSMSSDGGGGDGWYSPQGYQPQHQYLQTPDSALPRIAPQQGGQQMSQPPFMGEQSFQQQEAHQTSRPLSMDPRAFHHQIENPLRGPAPQNTGPGFISPANGSGFNQSANQFASSGSFNGQSALPCSQAASIPRPPLRTPDPSPDGRSAAAPRVKSSFERRDPNQPSESNDEMTF